MTDSERLILIKEACKVLEKIEIGIESWKNQLKARNEAAKIIH